LRIGIHTSTSGALANAARLARDLGANCFQIFSSSPRMWRSAPPSPEQVKELKAARAEHDLNPLVIHTAYLINCASADPVIRQKSIAAFRDEVDRALLIGAEYLVMHPGSAKDQTVEQAIPILAASLAEASKGLRPRNFTLLLENTAGGGSTLGRTLEELRAIHDAVQPVVPFPVAYCLDTCHLFVAGYNVANETGLRDTVKLAGSVLGLDNIPVIHTNDSKGALGSRLDRHANIGEGQIGLDGFRRILCHPKLRKKAFILETPIDNPGDDRKNVDALWSLVR
jgi:deoxyribonuclease IV